MIKFEIQHIQTIIQYINKFKSLTKLLQINKKYSKAIHETKQNPNFTSQSEVQLYSQIFNPQILSCYFNRLEKKYYEKAKQITNIYVIVHPECFYYELYDAQRKKSNVILNEEILKKCLTIDCHSEMKKTFKEKRSFDKYDMNNDIITTLCSIVTKEMKLIFDDVLLFVQFHQLFHQLQFDIEKYPKQIVLKSIDSLNGLLVKKDDDLNNVFQWLKTLNDEFEIDRKKHNIIVYKNDIISKNEENIIKELPITIVTSHFVGLNEKKLDNNENDEMMKKPIIYYTPMESNKSFDVLLNKNLITITYQRFIDKSKREELFETMKQIRCFHLVLHEYLDEEELSDQEEYFQFFESLKQITSPIEFPEYIKFIECIDSINGKSTEKLPILFNNCQFLYIKSKNISIQIPEKNSLKQLILKNVSFETNQNIQNFQHQISFESLSQNLKMVQFENISGLHISNEFTDLHIFKIINCQNCSFTISFKQIKEYTLSQCISCHLTFIDIPDEEIEFDHFTNCKLFFKQREKHIKQTFIFLRRTTFWSNFLLFSICSC